MSEAVKTELAPSQSTSLQHLRAAWGSYERGLQRVGHGLAGLVAGHMDDKQAARRMDSAVSAIWDATLSVRQAEAVIPEIWEGHKVVEDLFERATVTDAELISSATRASVRMLAKPSVREQAGRAHHGIGSRAPWVSSLPAWLTGLEVYSQRQLAAVGIGSVSRSGERALFTGTEQGNAAIVKLGQAVAQSVTGPSDVALEALGDRPESPALLAIWGAAAGRLEQMRDLGRYGDAFKIAPDSPESPSYVQAALVLDRARCIPELTEMTVAPVITGLTTGSPRPGESLIG